MNWIEGLLEPLLDRLALKLAAKVRGQLNGAIDAAIDRAEDRIDTAFEGLEERLLAAANKAMEDVFRQALGPIADLEERLVAAAEKAMADVVQKAMGSIAEVKGAVAPALALQQRIEAIGPEQLQAAAEAAGMVPAEAMKAQIGFAASTASAAAREELRSRLTPPRPWLERPDR